ncbi:MAG: hypothetical protein ACP5E3_02490, partial [Bacteroidales bacterium]
MESVKAMTSVDLNNDPVSTSSGKTGEESDNVTISKGNSDNFGEGEVNTEQRSSPVNKDNLDTPQEKTVQGLFAKIRLGIKSFLRIFRKKTIS